MDPRDVDETMAAPPLENLPRLDIIDESANLPHWVPSVLALPRQTIHVKAIGLHLEGWYYSALKGTFNMCYAEHYIDPSLQCEYIKDNEPLSKADVVIFRGALLNHELARNVLQDKNRPENQWWVFFDNEPPYKVWKATNLSNFNRVFNLTATYSPDSDIPRVDMRRFKNCILKADRYEALKQMDYTWKKRNGTVVAWFASECATQSKREKYIKELQKHIPVDIYGECGPLKCGSRSLGTWSKDKCHEKLLHKRNSYKFYLSFENSLCKDYVTEKLWMLEYLDVVPVVMGLADYDNMLPPDTYINVRNFPNPKALAKYLHYLNNNNEAYNQYLRKRHSLHCYLKYPYMPWECKLCEAMHKLNGTNRVVYDLGKFWGRSQCMSPVEFFRKRPENDFNS